MLNRIYIVVGLLAIVVLAGAFIVPYFIQWSDYRGRMEELATSVLGTPVTVRGDIEFTLLPQPRLHFNDVLVGSPEEPAATVDSVEAEFSLMDFLRDNYTVTRLILQGPVIDFTIDDSGFFGSGVSVDGANGAVGLGQATIVDATVRLMDHRSGENFVAEKVSGELRLSSFSGPFSFQGTGSYRDTPYSLRFNSGVAGSNGASRTSVFLQPQSGAFSFSLDGALTPGMAPKFEGDMVYRQKPVVTDVATDIRGDMVVESKVTGSTDRIVLTGYTLRPDENRASTRLTGAASIQLGHDRSFDAVVSGGVFSLPPRDVNEDTSTQPYEIIRLLTELPPPIIPPMAGRVGVDLAEIGLRGVALRNVRMDANFDGKDWQVQQFIGQLPGDTEVRASGEVSRQDNRPAFHGQVSISSNRLDGLAQIWRKPGEDSPLFNVPGSLSGRVMLAGDAFGLVNGVLTLNQKPHGLEIRLGFGDEKRLDVVGHFDALSTGDSAVLAALIPDVAGENAFALSFPEGSFSFTANSATVYGLDGTGLVAEGQWMASGVRLSRLGATEWGGVGVNASGKVSGSLSDPTLSGMGTVSIALGTAPALQRFYNLYGTPTAWRDYLARSAPASIHFDIGDRNSEGGQLVTLDGDLGTAALNLRAELSSGLFGITTAPLRITGALESSDVDALSEQIGFGETPIFDGDGSMLVSFGLEGTATNSLASNLTASLGEESISFSGNLLTGPNSEIQGDGTLDVALGDAGGLGTIIGARGLSLPMAKGTGKLHFEGERLARLTEIVGKSGDTAFTGEVSLSRTGTTAAVAGTIAVDSVSVEGLAATLFGPAALVGQTSAWPQGPISLGDTTRRTRGTVSVTAGSVTAAGVERLGKTSFELNWDETRIRLARFEAAVGQGKLGLDVAVCCSGPLSDKTISGRMTLDAVPVATIAPPSVAGGLDGVLGGGARFEGSGASLAEVFAAMTGEGNFTLANLTAQRLSPTVFPTVAGLDDVLNTAAQDLSSIMSVALGQGAFTAPTTAGAFTIAGGVLRLANVMIDGNGAALSGGLNIALSTLGLNGSFVMAPKNVDDASGLIGGDNSRIIAGVTGTVTSPVVTVDLDEMVAAVLLRANELELDRLEALRAEDAERQRAAAEERNRLIDEQRRRAAEEAARVAAQEAARLAAEQEAQRVEQERQLQLQLQQQQQAPVAPPTAPAPVQPLPSGALDLGLPPAPPPGNTMIFTQPQF
ncbi:AsmA family protein [Devosia sp. 2618]|uniref:AsmA family protein n=1 Tax=Devosia sp. 2618 TaxID=3156454 RepID=UPI003392B941